MRKQGLILAAGYSSRFPEYKMIQSFHNKTILEWTIIKMKPFVSEIIVVTGYRHKDIALLLKPYKDVVCVYNDQFEKGMFSSIVKGAEFIENDFYMIPGDCPVVSSETYVQLKEVKGDVVIPSYEMKAGHPIKISKKLLQALRNTEAEHMRAFLQSYNKTYVEVNDPGILTDVDTKNDYIKIKRRFENEDY